MAKNKALGIEIGNNRIKLAVCSNLSLERVVSVEVPDNLVVDDVIVSWEAMADFIKEVVKENNITYKDVHMVLPERLAYVRRIAMPPMSVDQLNVNLPFEFHDYITQDKDSYYYDYSVIDMKRDEEGTPTEMELMCVAVSKEIIEHYKTMCRRAGLKLVLIAPEYVAFKNIVKEYEESHGVPSSNENDYAILDLGHRTLRLHFFTHGEYDVTRNMEPGCEEITRYIADKLNSDMHIAQITKELNQDDILNDTGCVELYNQMAVEIMRVLNFYNFNHQDNTLEYIYYCGGGSFAKPLLNAIEEMIDLKLVSIDQLLTDGYQNKEELIMGPQALGITWE